MANNLLSSNVLGAAISDPRQVRLIFSYFENGECIVEVQECFNVGSMTFEINGDATEVICTNIRTGENEVVAIIETGSTRKVTFDISRLLPQGEVSRFMKLVRRNCGLQMYLARANECIDPFNPNDFEVLDILGEVTLGNYSRTDMLSRDKSSAVAIEESTTVTAYDWFEAGHQEIATRGGLNTAPILDITLCDEDSCGGRCADDSDGCQRWFWIQEDGIVGYTNNQFANEAITSAISGWPLTFTKATITCGPRDLLLVTDETSTIYTTSRSSMLAGVTPVWTTLALDTDGNAIAGLNEGEEDSSQGVIWYVGDGATLYQFNPSLGTMTLVATVPGLTANFLDLDINGDNILIGGEDGTLLRSQDGGRSFALLTVTDPTTSAPVAPGIDFTAVEILSDVNIAVGTSDDRVLYTIDNNLTWASQLIAGAGAGAITDIEFDDVFHQVGWLTRNEGGVGSLWKTYYGNCEEWLELPENEESLPTNGGLNKVVTCPDDINVVAAAGENAGGAGIIFLGTTTER